MKNLSERRITEESVFVSSEGAWTPPRGRCVVQRSDKVGHRPLPYASLIRLD